jgi:hypothetical protein
VHLACERDHSSESDIALEKRQNVLGGKVVHRKAEVGNALCRKHTVGGPATELDSLAGEWAGEYWSADTGRSGSIHFRLEADDSAAWGDVTMFPGSGLPGAAEVREPATARLGAQALTIRFVRVANGQVSGTLDPYEDPVCGCMLSTVFTGVVAADHVEGSFVARGPAGRQESTGRWRVERVGQRP